MKKLLCMVLAMLLALSLVACGAQKADGSTYIGTWVCGRATLTIATEGDGYRCHIHWGSSAFESAEWDYLCYLDKTGVLKNDGTGERLSLVYAEDGSITTADEVYADGAATFTIGEDGLLMWQDAVEDAGKDMAFERVQFVGDTVTQEMFVNDYFRVIGGFAQGTSGSSLKMAQAACDALRFAVLNRIDNMDVQTLRDTLLTAWESMTDDERNAFDANFISVLQLMNDCFADWEGARGRFDDAGVGEDMAVLLADPSAQDAWSTLSSHTLTMGNSDG